LVGLSCFPQPSSAAPEPFTRKTTGLLMRSPARIVAAVDADQAESLLVPVGDQPMLGANLCEAVLAMQPTGDGSWLSVGVEAAASGVCATQA
jgi:hypothetical protein